MEPFIDEKTMELHHNKHLGTYVINLNNALAPHAEFHDWSIRQLISNLELLPKEIRTVVQNNGGGVYNHELFFDVLKRDVLPPTSGPFFNAIVASFDSIDNFKSELKSAGLEVFGSGWAWLVVDDLGKLVIGKTSNQNVPNLRKFTSIVNLDVWEHAYYLKNQNRRSEYIDNFLNVINWKKLEENYINR